MTQQIAVAQKTVVALDKKVADHQKAAEALLKTCGKFADLDVFDIIIEMNDGRYVSAKEGLTLITDDDEGDALKKEVSDLEGCFDITGLTRVKWSDSIPKDTVQLSIPVTKNTALACGNDLLVDLLHSSPGLSFRGAALSCYHDVQQTNPALANALDQEKVAEMFAEQDMHQLPDLPEGTERLEVSFLALCFALLMNKGAVLPPVILEAFAAVMEQFPDFVEFARQVRNGLEDMKAA